MKSSPSCPECGRSIARSAAMGLCSQCLLESILEPAVSADGFPGDFGDAAGRLFGDYELLGLIARGGMGVVYRARQRSLNRTVALKMIRAGEFASDAERKRFRAEAEAAAHLDHPHIVPIYEIGELDGQDYFAMKWIEVGTLAEAIRTRSAERDLGPPDARLRDDVGLLVKIARAVHYAHQRGVLHRDLKPANILLDARGEPFVSDFGLAKRLESGGDLTLTGAVMGSPNYMSPEQAAGRTREITTAADIYSLGAILYELMAGRPPFQAETPLATMRQVMDEEPEPPRRVRTGRPAGDSGYGPLSRRAGIVDRDLETICLECLHKAPARRYSTAEALAEDLDRWLRHEPIQARASTARERAFKWARRHPSQAALSAVSLVAAMGFFVLILIHGQRLERERNVAVAHQQRATSAALHAELEAKRADEARAESRVNLYAADMRLAQHALDEGNFSLARQLVDAYRPTHAQSANSGREFLPDLRGFEWRLLWQQTRGREIRTLVGHKIPVTCVSFSPDGRTLVAGFERGQLQSWNLETGTLLPPWPLATGAFKALSHSPDGKWLLTGLEDGKIHIWDIARRAVVWGFQGHEDPRAKFCGSGALVAVYLPDPVNGYVARDTVKVINWQTRQELYSWPTVGSLEDVSADGRTLATCYPRPNTVEVWDLATGTKRSTLTNQTCTSIALSPDGRWLAIHAGTEKVVQLCDASGRAPRIVLEGHTKSVTSMQFSPDGKLLASGSKDQSVRLWDLATQRQVAHLRGHDGAVLGLAFSPDGKTLATASTDQTVKVWTVDTREPFQAITNMFPPFIVSPDGTKLAATTAAKTQIANKQVVVCDLIHESSAVLAEAGFSRPVFFSADNRSLATLDEDAAGQSVLRYWEVSDQSPRASVRLAGQRKGPFATAVSPDRSWLAVGEAEAEITLWDTGTGALLKTLPAPAGHTKRKADCFAVSADGRSLAASYRLWLKPDVIVLWGLDRPGEPVLLEDPPENVHELCMAPSGEWVVAEGNDHAIRWWDARTGRLKASIAGQSNGIQSADFSPNYRTLATVDGEVLKLWHAATHRGVAVWSEEGFVTRWCRFTRDESSLVIADWHGYIRVLSPPTLEAIDRLP